MRPSKALVGFLVVVAVNAGSMEGDPIARRRRTYVSTAWYTPTEGEGAQSQPGVNEPNHHSEVPSLKLVNPADPRNAGVPPPPPAFCADIVNGQIQTAERRCPYGVMMCLTSELTNTKKYPTGLNTSSCDEHRLCEGLTPGGYFRLDDGQCGVMPVYQQTIYCSRNQPVYGRIPQDMECAKIEMQNGKYVVVKKPIHKKKNWWTDLGTDEEWTKAGVMLATCITICCWICISLALLKVQVPVLGPSPFFQFRLGQSGKSAQNREGNTQDVD